MTQSQIFHKNKNILANIQKETRTIGVPEPTEVQVAVQATGLCGSDLHYYNHYRNGDIIVREPMTLGHESAGVVTAVGSEVTDLNIGDHVALEVGLPCKFCELCATGRYNICKEMKFRSSAKAFPHFQGTLQERINHPAAYCHRYVIIPYISDPVLTIKDCLQAYLLSLVPYSNLSVSPYMLREEQLYPRARQSSSLVLGQWVSYVQRCVE